MQIIEPGGHRLPCGDGTGSTGRQLERRPSELGAARELERTWRAFVVTNGEVATALAVPDGTSRSGSVSRFIVASILDTRADIIPTSDSTRTETNTSAVDTRRKVIPAISDGAALWATARLL